MWKRLRTATPIPVIRTAQASNIKSHLLNKAHHGESITETSTVVVEALKKREDEERRRQPTLDIGMACRARMVTQIRHMLLFGDPLVRAGLADFQEVFDQLPKSRVVLRRELIAESERVHQSAVKTLVTRPVTLAIDGGTIWEKYMAVVVLAAGRPPLLWRFIHCDVAMTAAWIEQELDACIEAMRSVSIFPIAIAHDNASNMVAGIRTLRVGLGQRCLAHTLQLAVNDAFVTDVYAKVWDAVTTVVEANRNVLRLPPITRWSGKYLLLADILNRNGSEDSAKHLDISGIDPSIYGHFEACRRALSHVFYATQVVQADNANMIKAAAVIGSLLLLRASNPRGPNGRPNIDSYMYELVQKIKNRASMLITDAVLVTAFFTPSYHRHAAPAAVYEHVMRVVGRVASVYNMGALSEVPKFRTHGPSPVPPATPEQKYTIQEYRDFWNASIMYGYPNIIWAINTIAACNPTEASCERAFSICKWAFDRLRTRSLADLVEATMRGNSAINFLRGRLSADPEDEEVVTRNEPPTGTDNFIHTELGVTGATAIITAWAALNSETRVNPPQPRAHREWHCVACNKHYEEHGPDKSEHWAICDSCRGYFNFDCVGIADIDQPQVSVSWKCRRCAVTHVL